MNTKTYKIGTHALGWYAIVEINFDHSFMGSTGRTTTEEAIKEMVEFWSGWRLRLKDLHNSYTLVFLNNLACEIIGEIAVHNHRLSGILEHFRKADGWYPMNGSAGIIIKSVDSFRWTDDLDVDIEEVEQ